MALYCYIEDQFADRLGLVEIRNDGTGATKLNPERNDGYANYDVALRHPDDRTLIRARVERWDRQQPAWKLAGQALAALALSDGSGGQATISGAEDGDNDV